MVPGLSQRRGSERSDGTPSPGCRPCDGILSERMGARGAPQPADTALRGVIDMEGVLLKADSSASNEPSRLPRFVGRADTPTVKGVITFFKEALRVRKASGPLRSCLLAWSQAAWVRRRPTAPSSLVTVRSGQGLRAQRRNSRRMRAFSPKRSRSRPHRTENSSHPRCSRTKHRLERVARRTTTSARRLLSVAKKRL